MSSHVSQTTMTDDAQQQQQQQVRDVTHVTSDVTHVTDDVKHDVTGDVSQCWTVTEMHARRQSPVVGDEVDGSDYGLRDLTTM